MDKIVCLLMLSVLFCASVAFAQEGQVDQGNRDFVEFQQLLDTQCSKCHTRVRIEQAMAEQRAFQPIIERMVEHGADLSSRQRDVLGVFWQENTSSGKAPVVSLEDDPLGEYRAIVAARCTGCHDLGRVEEAMRQNRSFATLAEMMLKRGAILTEADYKVIGTFWGEPLR